MQQGTSTAQHTPHSRYSPQKQYNAPLLNEATPANTPSASKINKPDVRLRLALGTRAPGAATRRVKPRHRQQLPGSEHRLLLECRGVQVPEVGKRAKRRQPARARPLALRLAQILRRGLVVVVLLPHVLLLLEVLLVLAELLLLLLLLLLLVERVVQLRLRRLPARRHGLLPLLLLLLLLGRVVVGEEEVARLLPPGWLRRRCAGRQGADAPRAQHFMVPQLLDGLAGRRGRGRVRKVRDRMAAEAVLPLLPDAPAARRLCTTCRTVAATLLDSVGSAPPPPYAPPPPPRPDVQAVLLEMAFDVVNDRHTGGGILSMANAGPNTNGSQ
ncbi:hypothetical protein TSOC_005629 [Tetrabaena socialis]|uniref:Uncharacterized protein n=1 Tax=Tetrabaena socialis TaxID=47790 RepID=A0A2J8A5T7_9CHLO|nr:hypothetical protein TSOC_005629 [Tetrabaena socialis]|eukprot:PNH07863.1 hypothetical protein TSOC_005629 [Tetrabaena socialis]